MSNLVDFIDDENEFNKSVANYYAFTNVGRGVEDAMQDSFIDFDYSQEASNYCPKHYDRKNEVMDMFKDCEIRLRISKALSSVWNFFGNIDSFYHPLLYAIKYQSKNKKVCK